MQDPQRTLAKAVGRMTLFVLALAGSLAVSRSLAEENGDSAKPVHDVVAAAGGEEKLLKLFRFSERVLAIDYTDTRHVFSEWKKSDAGHAYPSHVVGFRFADKAARKLNEAQWYQTDILELTPLPELPTELTK